MKLALSLSLFLFSFVIFPDESFSLTNYKIQQICNKERKIANCKLPSLNAIKDSEVAMEIEI